MHRSTRRTARGSAAAGSSSTSRKRPALSASTGEAARGSRSRLFGVKTTSGRAEAAAHLAAQQVEVLGGRRAVRDLEVVLGAELQEALDARARVLRPLALVAVREQQHETAHALPLGVGGGDELVDDHLGAVREVAELRLPERQRRRVGEAVAVLEAEHRRPRRAGCRRPRSAPASRPRWSSGAYSSPVRWSTSTAWRWLKVPRRAVLAREAHRRPLDQQAAEGERLGDRPVERPRRPPPTCGAGPGASAASGGSRSRAASPRGARRPAARRSTGTPRLRVVARLAACAGRPLQGPRGS